MRDEYSVRHNVDFFKHDDHVSWYCVGTPVISSFLNENQIPILQVCKFKELYAKGRWDPNPRAPSLCPELYLPSGAVSLIANLGRWMQTSCILHKPNILTRESINIYLFNQLNFRDKVEDLYVIQKCQQFWLLLTWGSLYISPSAPSFSCPHPSPSFDTKSFIAEETGQHFNWSVGIDLSPLSAWSLK